MTDRWLTLAEVGAMFGLSERAVLARKSRGLPVRRVTPKANPIIIESELRAWIKRQTRKAERLSKHMPA